MTDIAFASLRRDVLLSALSLAQQPRVLQRLDVRQVAQ